MDTGGSDQWTCSSSHEQHGGAPPPPKRPAGRTKFKETRHPVYRGVRTRGAAGRWVCEIRLPGNHGKRLWLGTYFSAELAARGHDAAMLMLRGSHYPGNPAAASASCLLNFPDSAWLLDVPRALPADPADARRAALAAVADFQQRRGVAAAAVPVAQDSSSSASNNMTDNNASSSRAKFDVPVGTSSGMSQLDMSGEMDLGVHRYYADLAEGLLMEPPQTAGACWESGDDDDDALWNH